jgi:hypothetical protein
MPAFSLDEQIGVLFPLRCESAQGNEGRKMEVSASQA